MIAKFYFAGENPEEAVAVYAVKVDALTQLPIIGDRVEFFIGTNFYCGVVKERNFTYGSANDIHIHFE